VQPFIDKQWITDFEAEHVFGRRPSTPRRSLWMVCRQDVAAEPKWCPGLAGQLAPVVLVHEFDAVPEPAPQQNFNPKHPKT
jgi:hypothetical protein